MRALSQIPLRPPPHASLSPQSKTLTSPSSPRSATRQRTPEQPRERSARRFSIARADFFERTRRYSFFLALLFAVFLGYATATGKLFIQFDEYRGLYTSGWIGTLVALVITCFVSLVGFYIVKNSVDRDRSTGVGQILAATSLSKTTYAFGKFLSNFAVLSSMVAVLAVAALVMQFWAAEDSRIDLWALLSPLSSVGAAGHRSHRGLRPVLRNVALPRRGLRKRCLVFRLGFRHCSSGPERPSLVGSDGSDLGHEFAGHRS